MKSRNKGKRNRCESLRYKTCKNLETTVGVKQGPKGMCGEIREQEG